MFNYLIKVKWKTIDKRWEYIATTITEVQSILQTFEFDRAESYHMALEIANDLQRSDCNEVRVDSGVWCDELPCELSITKKNINFFGMNRTDYTKYAKPNDLYRTFQLTPEKVIFNDPATIVFWKDGTKTVVKCMEGDTYNPEVGLAMCVCKKVFDKKYHKFFKYYMKDAPTRPLLGNVTEATAASYYSPVDEVINLIKAVFEDTKGESK